MNRQEAIEVLKEISNLCGNSILIDSVSLTPRKNPTQPLSDAPDLHFKLYLQASLDTTCESHIKTIATKRGLELAHTGSFLIIQRP